MTIKTVQETQGDEKGSLNDGTRLKFLNMQNKGVFCGSYGLNVHSSYTVYAPYKGQTVGTNFNGKRDAGHKESM